MVFSGGLFVGGVISIAWSASPPGGQPTRWTSRPGAHTPSDGGPHQPALLVICLVATTGFATVSGGAGRRMLAVLAAVGMLLVLSARWPVLVPISGGWAGPDPNHRRRIPPGGEPNGSAVT
jgi:hypothetical protein